MLSRTDQIATFSTDKGGINLAAWFHGCFALSPYMGTGSVEGIQVLCVLHMLIAAMVMVGYHTKLFSFLLVVSHLNIVVINIVPSRGFCSDSGPPGDVDAINRSCSMAC